MGFKMKTSTDYENKVISNSVDQLIFMPNSEGEHFYLITLLKKVFLRNQKRFREKLFREKC